MQDLQPQAFEAKHAPHAFTESAPTGITYLDDPARDIPIARPAAVSPTETPRAPAIPAPPAWSPSIPSHRTSFATGELTYAPFGARAAAAIIDVIILQFASMLLDSLFLGALLSNLSTTAILFATMGPVLAGGLLAIFYSVWLESSAWQATPGKRLMGLKVVDLEGRRIGFRKASGRNFAKGLSMLSLGIGYLMPLWSPRKQALHDKATGCLVIRAS